MSDSAAEQTQMEAEVLAARQATGCSYRRGGCTCPAPPFQYEGCEARPPAIDWTEWGKCPVCQQTSGRPCVALSGRVVGYRPDGIPTPILRPHAGRRRLLRHGVGVLQQGLA